MSATTTTTKLLERVKDLKQIPTIPAVLAPLLLYLEQPVEDLDIQKVTDVIAQDKALAAQCLRMANSPLFGRFQKIDASHGHPGVRFPAGQRYCDVLRCSQSHA